MGLIAEARSRASSKGAIATVPPRCASVLCPQVCVTLNKVLSLNTLTHPSLFVPPLSSQQLCPQATAPASLERGQDWLARSMDSDDFENFEFIDYTTSGPWERFIVQIEDCLKQWGLVSNSYGVFNPDVMASTEVAMDLDQELALALNDEHLGGTAASESVGMETDPVNPPSKAHQHSTTITLEDASYILSYRYHPAKARVAAGVQRIDLDFLPTSLEGQEHHILHRWTALTHILVLAPASNPDSVIIDLGCAKILLSSFAIAFQNTGCNIPVFVPTGQAKNKIYTGLSIRPQLSNAHDPELGPEWTSDDQAIEVRFNTVVVPYPPAQYTNFSGILDLFIERMGLENEPAAFEGDVSGSEGCSQEVKEQIFASALLSYHLDNRYDDQWRQWSDAADGNEGRTDEQSSTRLIPRLPVGPVHDPLKSLQLVARFGNTASLPLNMVFAYHV